MALSALIEWDVRTTGSNSNGGGFKSGATGTDYSQQNAAQVAYTDLVIDGALDTKVTSALNPFTANHVGNIINVTGGTGFTTGRYEVVSVASSAATLDRAVGTTSSTGGTGNLGGSLLTVQTPFTISVAGNTIWIKAGTYTVTATITDSGSGKTTNFYGYNATHSDWGTKPLITTATNSTPLFSFAAGYITFKNIRMTNSAGTRSTAIQADGNFPELAVVTCYFEHFTTAIDNIGGNFAGIAIFNSEFYDYSVTGIVANYRMSVFGSYFHGGTNNAGFAIFTSGVPALVVRNVFYSNNGYGLYVNATSVFLESNVFHTQRYGVFAGSTDGSLIANNVFWGTTNNAIETGNLTGIQANNAFGTNGTDRTLGANVAPPTSAGWGDITITVDPFTNAAGNDFSLNSTAGGGAALVGAGFPGVAPFGSGSLDVGAVQKAASAAGVINPLWGIIR